MDKQVEVYLAQKGQRFSNEGAKRDAMIIINRVRQNNAGMKFEEFMGWIHLGQWIVELEKVGNRR